MNKLLTAVFATALVLGAAQADAKDWTKLRIGVEGAFPPFSYVDKDGALQGFDIDIARALCDEMKAKCTLVQQDWDGIIPGLLVRKYDAIVASMSITPERKEKVAFTDKYYQTPFRFVRRKGSGIEITQEGLKGKTVGVQRAVVGDAYLTANYSDVVKIKRYATQDEAYLDMESGRVDLLLADAVPLMEFLKTDAGKSFEFVGPDLTDPKWFGDGIGIAVRKSDDDLRAKFNQAIAAIRSNGTYKKIQDKYFDFDIYGQ